MDLIVAQHIVNDWNQHYWEGRVKTRQVMMAEDIVEGRPPRVAVVTERHAKLIKSSYNEKQNEQRRAKQLQRFLVCVSGNNNDTDSAGFPGSNHLDRIQDKRFRIIVEVVVRAYRLDVAEVLGMCRNTDLVHARSVIIYLSICSGVGSLEEIGRLIRLPEFTAMDHSTVIHARNSVLDHIDDPKFKAVLEEFTFKINNRYAEMSR